MKKPEKKLRKAKTRFTKYSPQEIEYCKRQTLVSLCYFFREELLFLDQNPSEVQFRKRFTGRELVALRKHGVVESVYRQRSRHEGKWYIINPEALELLNSINEEEYRKMLNVVYDSPLPNETLIEDVL